MADVSHARDAERQESKTSPHTLTTPGRSRNMRAIKRTGTRPEIAVRSELHRAGYRFRKDYVLRLPTMTVRPDIVFTKRKVAVFVDGCFWHVCPIHGRIPTVNDTYWRPKLLRNVERDRLADQALLAEGWRVVSVWEHVDLHEAIREIEHTFDTRDL